MICRLGHGTLLCRVFYCAKSEPPVSGACELYVWGRAAGRPPAVIRPAGAGRCLLCIVVHSLVTEDL